MEIREEIPSDYSAISEINDEAFKGTYESTLITQLRADGFVISSLVSLDLKTQDLIGHILFSEMKVEVDGKSIKCCAVAPIAVRPSHQRQGIGSKLIQKGLAVVKEKGYSAVIVLGHEDYYPKFGFSHKLVSHLKSPFQEKGAFMGLELIPLALSGSAGFAKYPSAFGIKDDD